MKAKSLVTIAIADDHPIVRKGVIHILKDDTTLDVIIEANNGVNLIEQIERCKVLPDVCVLDINMPVMDGFDTLMVLKKRWPEIYVLILTASDAQPYLIKMVLNGANGYLSKNCHPEEIKNAIYKIKENGIYYSDSNMRHFFHAVLKKEIKLPHLTATEIMVLKLSCSDLSYAEIAQKIGSSSKSIEGYRESLFKKLNVKSRVSLVIFAIQFGYVQLDTMNLENKIPFETI